MCLEYHGTIPRLRPGPREIVALQAQMAIHVVLLMLMTVTSFIDIDEQMVPDAVTVPGTVIALLLAALCTSPALPSLYVDPNLQPRPADLVAPLRFNYTVHASGVSSKPGVLGVGIVRLSWLVLRAVAETLAEGSRNSQGMASDVAADFRAAGLDLGHAIGRGRNDVHRLSLVPRRGCLARIAFGTDRIGRRWRAGLGDPLDRRLGASARSDGFRRCDTDGDDRSVYRLASRDFGVLLGAVCRCSVGSAAGAVGPRKYHSLWAILVPGDIGGNPFLVADLGLRRTDVRDPMASAVGDRDLHAALGGPVVCLARNPNEADRR